MTHLNRVHTIVVPPDLPVLVLEDDDLRMRWFRNRMPWLTHARTPSDVQEALRHMGEFSMLFLDHDLGHTVGWEPGAPTGYDAAQIVAASRHGAKWDTIIIHSVNPAGAKRMHDVLPAARRMPFGSFEIRVMGRA